MLYTITRQDITLHYDPEALSLTLHQNDVLWRWATVPAIIRADGTRLSFADAVCDSSPYRTGVTDGVRASYRRFTDGKTEYPYTVETFVGLDLTDGTLRAEMRLEGDEKGELKEVRYPGAFALEAGPDEGYTVLPMMQGTLLPAGHPLEMEGGIIFERTAYLPIFGQVNRGSGYLAVYDTPYDAQYHLHSSQVQPVFVPSLGRMGYKRVMLYQFREACDYTVMASLYRTYLRERGGLVTLKEKIARNPRVGDLIGRPVIHLTTACHISPDSDYYRPGDPEHNDNCVTFDERAAQLRALKDRGLKDAYVHLDGWGHHGYDNLHPDVFPPHEGAGGADGLRRLQQTCTDIGYLFAVHDQYRDYYYDGASFSLDNAVTELDGGHPFCSIWFGGKHSYLCSALAPEYVRRNYNTFRDLDIKLDGSYLDVFSVVKLDECFHPDHPATRQQCAENRRHCLDLLTARGIIPSSEEVLGCIADSQVLCHHAPFYTTQFESRGGDAIGIPIPLLALVYHDCVIIPWIGLKTRGGWGIPAAECPYLWALLCGSPVYCDIGEAKENLYLVEIARTLAKQVALVPMVRHEWVGGDPRQRRTEFADGTVVEANLETTAFTIRYPDGRTVCSTEKLA